MRLRAITLVLAVLVAVPGVGSAAELDGFALNVSDLRTILSGARQQAKLVEQHLSGRGLPGTVTGAPREIIGRLERLTRTAGSRLRVSQAPRQTATDTQFEFRDGARSVTLLVMARTSELSAPQIHLEVRAGQRLMERLAVVGAGGPVNMVQVSREYRVSTGIRRQQLRYHPLPRRNAWVAVEQRSGQRSQTYLLTRGDRSKLSPRGADRLLAGLGTTTSALAPTSRANVRRQWAIRPRSRTASRD